jgi:hypothetical protein
MDLFSQIIKYDLNLYLRYREDKTKGLHYILSAVKNGAPNFFTLTIKGMTKNTNTFPIDFTISYTQYQSVNRYVIYKYNKDHLDIHLDEFMNDGKVVIMDYILVPFTHFKYNGIVLYSGIYVGNSYNIYVYLNLVFPAGVPFDHIYKDSREFDYEW